MKNDLQNLDSKRQFPLASTLAYDYENRLTQHATGMLGITVAHKYDGLGRLVRTDRTTAGPTTTQFEHVRDGLKLVGNIDATNTNTAPTWTNKPGALRPVESQQVVTNSATQYINVSDEISPARRTYNPSTSAAGDTEAIAAKGRLVLVNGATPALAASLAVNPSELFSQRNMTYNENSIALPSDRGTLEISGANLMYEGARVKSWMLGRDVNPAGRGDGAYYAQGAFSIGSVRPSPTTTPVGGWGNSINNDVNFGLVEKEEDENRGYDIFISEGHISISYRSSGKCPRCFSAIESPAKKGCYLYVRKWQSGQDCRTDIGCDCGWPEGRGPSAGQVDGKDVPPCGGNLSIGGTPIFNPPGADSCPGCDIPVGPPQTNMPGPGIPGAPNLPGRPGTNRSFGGFNYGYAGNYSSGHTFGAPEGSSWIYGAGVLGNSDWDYEERVRVIDWDCYRECRKKVRKDTENQYQNFFSWFLDLIIDDLDTIDKAILNSLNLALIKLLLYCGQIGKDVSKSLGRTWGLLEVFWLTAWLIGERHYCLDECTIGYTTYPPRIRRPRPVD